MLNRTMEFWKLIVEYQMYGRYLIFFGAGGNGRATCKWLQKENYTVHFFCDNNPALWGTTILGIPCISRDELNAYRYNSIILVTPSDRKNIEQDLKLNEFTYICGFAENINIHQYYFPKLKQQGDYENCFPFNHYESPYPDLSEMRKNEKQIFDINHEILDIDFNEKRQLEILSEMNKMQKDCILWPCEADKTGKLRYYTQNNWFGHGDAYILQCMLRIMKPKKIIELGSGFSTAAALDTNEYLFHNTISISCIEPNAERLKSMLKPTDNIQIFECMLQSMPVDYFTELNEGDLLFIDSSHVAKINGDVNFILFEILPRIKKGVYIHFHDIFYPFTYDKEWIYQGRAYNEAFILRAFLQNNDNYSIQYYNHMMALKNSEMYPDLPIWGVSLWIYKK